MADADTFEIGLVMAGAISAGAYTAGVIDFLYEALDAWEAEKIANPETTPRHKVKIKVITGASAGGMTAALIASTIRRAVTPVKLPGANPGSDNPFYDAWVSQIDIEKLLRNDDLADDGPVKSVLNANVLQTIADSVFVGGTPLNARRRYFADKVDLFLTVTNLGGVPYAIKMHNKDVSHGMKLHKDFVHFDIDGADPRRVPSDKLTDARWTDVRLAALASGAFPIGLSAKQVARLGGDYSKHVATVAGPGGTPAYIAPDWDLIATSPYNTGCVDGGMMDNEPLELARQTLSGGEDIQNPREADQASRAVLMIDPFPDSVRMTQADALKKVEVGLLNIFGALLPAFKNQARFKVEELTLAVDENVYSRFMIAPVREEKAADGTPTFTTSIACGSLGGFGGFLDRDFRDHDYQLGRRNCQQFLRTSFMLPAANPVMQAWGPADKTAYADADGDLPIIPLMPSVRKPIEQQPWPTVHPQDMEDLLTSRVKNRFVQVVRKLLGQANVEGFKRAAAETVLRLLDDDLTDYAVKKVLDSLKANKQLEDPADTTRRRLSPFTNNPHGVIVPR